LNSFPFGAYSFKSLGFHTAIEDYHIPALGGQLCAASAFPSLDACHQRMFETVVHGIDQVPRPAVAQSQFACSGRDGPGTLDSFQQVYFPRTQGDVFSRLDADTGTAGEFGLFGFSQGMFFTF